MSFSRKPVLGNRIMTDQSESITLETVIEWMSQIYPRLNIKILPFVQNFVQFSIFAQVSDFWRLLLNVET